MNAPTPRNTSRLPVMHETGMALLEVLIAMVIFVIGMLALAHLQGNLSRSSADANTRTVAANIAEEIIEDKRAFEVVTSEPGKKAYQDLVDETKTVFRGGIEYAVNFDVQDYYFNPDRVSVQKTAPSGVTHSNFKFAEVTVSSNTGMEFQIDKTQSTSSQLGSGSIKISSIIPSAPPLNNAKVAAEDDGALGYPPVNYQPGKRPDIVAIKLGANKFKESTTPEPIVRRRDELLETWFDVITYTSNGNNSIFLRREEFASISCECTLRASAGSGSKDGRQPTIWTGAKYAEGQKVAKQYGESASNQQSQYCEVCCQDHHDTGSGPDSYRPLAGSFSGDHPHYNRNQSGVLSAVGVGGTYIEACRLVRKDGFFRVAQDFTLEGQNAFPENYLDDTSETDDYSDYVAAVVADHFENGTSPLTPPAAGSLTFEGRDDPHPTDLPTASMAENQQLRSRGIYTDVIGTSLANNLYNCFDANGDVDLCEAPNASNPIELYPFFDLQLTQLARWTETNPDDPVDITNEEIDNRGYSRGMAKLAGGKIGKSKSHSGIEKGNVGLISIAPVTAVPPPAYSYADLFIVAGGVPTPPPPIGNPIISGSLTSAGGTGTEVASVGGNGANCTRPTNTTFICLIDPVALQHTLTVSNYYKRSSNLIACSSQLTTLSFTQGDSLSANSTTFELPSTDLSSVTIVISRQPCP